MLSPMSDAGQIAASRPDLGDADLMLQFESIGDNCELGLVQRRLGAEPMGLFRFIGAPLPNLLRALHAEFDGLVDPAQVEVTLGRDEYMIRLAKYDFIYHPFVKPGELAPDVLHRLECRKLKAVLTKFIEDLRSADKILVFRQNEPLQANDLLDLRAALDLYGHSTLLWVQSARPGHPPGTVDIIDDRLMVGYVRRLAPRENVPDLDIDSWLSVLRRSYALWPERHRPVTLRPTREAVFEPHAKLVRVFGVDGDAEESTGQGWSTPENGFTWAIGERSLLSLPAPPAADDYWLELDVVPYIAPPVVPKQILAVSVSGEHVHTFDPLERGVVGCAIPGRLVRGQETIEITLDHPRAARPSEVAGEADGRRLAIAFRSLALVYAAAS